MINVAWGDWQFYHGYDVLHVFAGILEHLQNTDTVYLPAYHRMIQSLQDFVNYFCDSGAGACGLMSVQSIYFQSFLCFIFLNWLFGGLLVYDHQSLFNIQSAAQDLIKYIGGSLKASFLPCLSYIPFYFCCGPATFQLGWYRRCHGRHEKLLVKVKDFFAIVCWNSFSCLGWAWVTSSMHHLLTPALYLLLPRWHCSHASFLLISVWEE